MRRSNFAFQASLSRKFRTPASNRHAKDFEWHRDFVSKFDHEVDITMGLRRTAPLLPAERLFLGLPSMDESTHFPNDHARSQFIGDVAIKYEDLEFGAEDDYLIDLVMRKSTPPLEKRGALLMLDHHRTLVKQAVFRTQRLVESLSALHTKRSQPALVAEALAEVSGFDTSWVAPDSTRPFKSAPNENITFMLGGEEVDVAPCLSVVRKCSLISEDLALVFQDTSSPHLELILIELLMCHYHRLSGTRGGAAKQDSTRVFAVRLFGKHASMYSLEATPDQVREVCLQPQARWASAGKMKFTSSVAEPSSADEIKRGSNLMLQSERRDFIRLLAGLRDHLLHACY
jgi:hypothetical protein